MAYILWRVVMKKYSRVRLGLHKAPYSNTVTPTDRHVLNYDEESWKPGSLEEEKAKEGLVQDQDEFLRASEARQSKTKRVKNYLKKCKNALGKSASSSSASYDPNSTEQKQCSESNTPTSSWYLEDKNINEGEICFLEDEQEVICEGEIQEVDEDIFEEASSIGNVDDLTQVATVIDSKRPLSLYLDGNIKEPDLESIISSPFLPDEQKTVDGNCQEKQEQTNIIKGQQQQQNVDVDAKQDNTKIKKNVLERQPTEEEIIRELVLGRQASVEKEKKSNKREKDNKESKKCDEEVKEVKETVKNSDIKNDNKEKIVSDIAVEENTVCVTTVEDLIADGEVVEEYQEDETYVAYLGGEDGVISEIKNDVVTLVDRYFGYIYENYEGSRKSLIRQARDLLVCEYHGCLQRFEDDFCIPGTKLLQYVKEENSSNLCVPKGWPLCLGSSGVVVHLGPLSPTLVRNKDCYLCLRARSQPGLELALVWRQKGNIRCKTIAEFKNPLSNLDEMMCSSISLTMDLETSSTSDDEIDSFELPELLQNLLVSIEHAIERVPLDDLAFPCPECLEYAPLEKQVNETCSCSCTCTETIKTPVVKKKDSSIQTSPMFEFAGSIPHIDSDEEDDKESIRSGLSGPKEMVRPTKITELPEKLLMSGINLPGTVDVGGRPIVLCYAECIARAGLNKYEVAKLLLYYATVTGRDQSKKGFTILLLAEAEHRHKALEVLDKACLLISNYIKISRILIWRPGVEDDEFSNCRHQVILVKDEAALGQYIKKDQAPAGCGGNCNHDQLEWVEFFKQFEPFLASCRLAGRSLLSTLSQLRNEDVPHQVTRRFLNHQWRQIMKALQLDFIQKVRNESKATLASLEERTQWLSSNKDIKEACEMAKKSAVTIDKVASRLEQLAQDRKARIKELMRLKAIHDEAEEILSWIRGPADDALRNHALLLRNAISSQCAKEVEDDFQKFYFDAMRQIEKGADITEESNNIADVKGNSRKEAIYALKAEMKTFSERLEESRERLEDTMRCFQLLDSCHNFTEGESQKQEDFLQMAYRSGNEKLSQIYTQLKKGGETTIVQPPDKENDNDDDNKNCVNNGEPAASSTPLKPTLQLRRRSVSSLAFIYKCNHHAEGVQCNCYESDSENTVSYKLKKKYMQTLQSLALSPVSPTGSSSSSVSISGNGKETLERKTSAALDGIKEVRESVENLLEKLDTSCRACDSGVSTAENSVGDESVYKKKLHRTCSCQYYRESCALCSSNHSSSTGSNQDHTDIPQDSIIEEGSDGFVKSSEDIEEEHYEHERRKVPPVPSNSHLYCHSSILHLPTDVSDANMDPKTLKTLLFIMREMIQTERDYVKSLDYVIENYIPELMREDIPQSLRGQRNVVFGNIEKIYEFHSQHFLRELEQCENNPLQIGQIFLKHDNRFYLYALYNKNKPKSDSLLSEYGSEFFKSKQIKLGDNMDLASYLLKPVQRMGKYALLLQQMMKACPVLEPGASERAVTEQEDLKQAEQMVRFQLRHGNDLLAMDSIRECDVNLKEQGRLLRQNEFLVWEGKSGKKSLRQVFLFEELILFSKARRFPDRKNLDLYIYKNSIKMTDIGLTAKIGDTPTKFEIWFRKRKPNDTFTLQSMSEDVKKAWTEELSQLLWKQAIKNREVRMAEMSSMGIGNKPCLDIRPSVDQIKDRSISVDQLSRTAPRFRNSIVGTNLDVCRSSKRPHSVISMSSVSTSSSSSTSGSTGTATNPSTLIAYENNCDSPKPYHRSGTLNSQCSVESGIIADISIGSDECSENTTVGIHWPLEKSNSTHSNISSSKSSAHSTPTQSDDTQVTSFHIEDHTINI